MRLESHGCQVKLLFQAQRPPKEAPPPNRRILFQSEIFTRCQQDIHIGKRTLAKYITHKVLT